MNFLTKSKISKQKKVNVKIKIYYYTINVMSI